MRPNYAQGPATFFRSRTGKRALAPPGRPLSPPFKLRRCRQTDFNIGSEPDGPQMRLGVDGFQKIKKALRQSPGFGANSVVFVHCTNPIEGQGTSSLATRRSPPAQPTSRAIASPYSDDAKKSEDDREFIEKLFGREVARQRARSANRVRELRIPSWLSRRRSQGLLTEQFLKPSFQSLRQRPAIDRGAVPGSLKSRPFGRAFSWAGIARHRSISLL